MSVIRPSRSSFNRIEATTSQEGVVRGPHFCRNSMGFLRMGRLPEQLDQSFHTAIGQRFPLLYPLLEQPFIGGTLCRGVADQRCAPIAAPLAVLLTPPVQTLLLRLLS